MNTINNTTLGNTTYNNTNITDNSENNSIQRNIWTQNIPLECRVDAENLIGKLAEQRNISLEMEIESEINNNSTGKIVQIIDEKGHIHYLNVKSLDDTTITLITANKKEIIMTNDEFKKSFTGIVLFSNNFENHYLLIDIINELQKNSILKEATDAQTLKNKAKTNTIINGVVTGLGLVLFIVGIVLAVVFSRPASAEATLKMTDLGNEITDVFTSVEADEGSFTPSSYSSDAPPAPPSGGGSPDPFLEHFTS